MVLGDLIPTVSTIFWVVAGVITVAIISLAIAEFALKKKIRSKEVEIEKNFYLNKINSLKNSEKNPQLFLTELDETAKKFFEEKYNTNQKASYSDLISIFEEKKKNKEAEFCKLIQEVLYAGEESNIAKLKQLLSSFLFLVSQEKKKEDLEKQTQTQKFVFPFLKKIFVSGKSREPSKVSKTPPIKIKEKQEKTEGFFSSLSQKISNIFSPNKDITPPIHIPKKTDERFEKTVQKVIETSQKIDKAPQKIKRAPAFIGEKLEVSKVKERKREPIVFSYIKSVDNLDRIKTKINKIKANRILTLQ